MRVIKLQSLLAVTTSFLLWLQCHWGHLLSSTQTRSPTKIMATSPNSPLLHLLLQDSHQPIRLHNNLMRPSVRNSTSNISQLLHQISKQYLNLKYTNTNRQHTVLFPPRPWTRTSFSLILLMDPSILALCPNQRTASLVDRLACSPRLAVHLLRVCRI